MLTFEEEKIIKRNCKKRGMNKTQSKEYLNWIDKFISKIEENSPRFFLKKDTNEKFKNENNLNNSFITK